MRELFTILVRPSETIREVLARPSRIAIELVIVALTILSACVVEINGPHAPKNAPWYYIACVIALVVVAFYAVFFLLSWVARLYGQLLGGDGTFAALRTAVAFGLAPFAVVQLPIRVALFFAPHTMPVLVIRELVDFAIFIWSVMLLSITVGEAHRFSAWNGFATVVLTALTPLIVAVAAMLALK